MSVPNEEMIIDSADRRGDELHLELWYPRNEGAVTSLVIGLTDVRAADDIRVSYDFGRDGWKVIGLTDVRAADDIRVSYDFGRDGWKVEQASVFEWDADDTVCDPDWKEVAFIKAWAREKKKSEQQGAEANDDATEQPQVIDLTKAQLFCPTCSKPADARNRDGSDICCDSCDSCHTIITTVHPKPGSPEPEGQPT